MIFDKSLQPGELPRPLTRKEVLALPPAQETYFHASYIQGARSLVELLEKHGRLIPETPTRSRRERLRHDVIDMEYPVLGVLQRAPASKDGSMRTVFTLLRPDREVLPPIPVFEQNGLCDVTMMGTASVPTVRNWASASRRATACIASRAKGGARCNIDVAG